MAITKIEGKLKLRIGEKIVVVNGMTTADINKLKTALTDIDTLKGQVESFQQAQHELVDFDLSVADNQATAEAQALNAGIWYMVPKDRDGNFVKVSKTTGQIETMVDVLDDEGQPTGTQNPAVIYQYTVVFKNNDGTFTTTGSMYAQARLGDYVLASDFNAYKAVVDAELARLSSVSGEGITAAQEAADEANTRLDTLGITRVILSEVDVADEDVTDTTITFMPADEVLVADSGN